MRTIKFRAWDGERILKVVNVKDGYRELNDGEITVSQLFDEGYAPYTPMQFTGLLDKNGKEIYEGDVVEVDWDDDRYGRTNFVVKWDEEDACYSFQGGSPKTDALNHFEIIGNIYESPSLLEQKQ